MSVRIRPGDEAEVSSERWLVVRTRGNEVEVYHETLTHDGHPLTGAFEWVAADDWIGLWLYGELEDEPTDLELGGEA